MYQYYFHLCTPVNAHYFNIFRNFLMVVLSIPVYLRLHSLVMIDQSCPVYASAIDSRKHFLFFRETVKSSVDIYLWEEKEWGRTFLWSKKSHIAIIEAKCATWQVCSPDLHVKVNLWIDEQIIAKGDVAVEEGADMQTREQVLEIISKGFNVYFLMF